MQQILALTFDCYGTLVDWESGLARDLRAGLAPDAAASDEELLTWYSAAESEVEAGAFRPYRRVLRDALAGVARRANTTIRDSAALERGLPSWPVFPDAPAALRRLKQQFKLCVASNVDLDLFLITQQSLGVVFDEIVTADQIGSYKPAPAHFREALARLRAAPGSVLHVAQSLFHDHAPAKALGLRTVWIDRRAGRAGGATPPAPGSPAPDFRYETLEAFADAIINNRLAPRA